MDDPKSEKKNLKDNHEIIRGHDGWIST
jgi:hypothetical protein